MSTTMVRFLCALLLLGTVFSSAQQLSDDGEALRLQIDSKLTKHLLSLPNVEERILDHVARLQRWRTNVTSMQSRLDALETNQQGVVNQLSDVHQRLRSLAPVIRGTRVSLGRTASVAPGTLIWVNTIRTELKASITGVGEAVSGSVRPLQEQHQVTRAPCQESAVDLSESLTGLRTAVTQTVDQLTGAALSSRLDRVVSRLQETTQQLEKLDQQLRENQQPTPTTTTPAPTVDPLQEFLDALKTSLRERQMEKRNEGRQPT